MKDLSCHILDIVSNSLNAGASLIETVLEEDNQRGTLTLIIRDNGKGMTGAELKQVTDPFYTTSVTKRVGLGIPLLKQNAEMTGGFLNLESTVNQGTRVTAIFRHRHIDMIPLGDLAMTYRSLIAVNADRDIIFRYRKDGLGFDLDTAVIRHELPGTGINTREVLDCITDFIHTNLEEMKQS